MTRLKCLMSNEWPSFNICQESASRVHAISHWNFIGHWALGIFRFAGAVKNPKK
jgi:hypothetical protein